MTRMKEKVLLVGLVATFFIIPFLPSQLLMLTDLILVRFILLAALLAAVGTSPLVGIVALAVVGLLFIERNKAKMNYMKMVMSQSTPDSPAIAGIQSPETAPEQPEFNAPVQKSVPFFPGEESGENIFHPVSETINEKQVLPTESANGSRHAIEQLFEWVNPSLAQDAEP